MACKSSLHVHSVSQCILSMSCKIHQATKQTVMTAQRRHEASKHESFDSRGMIGGKVVGRHCLKCQMKHPIASNLLPDFAGPEHTARIYSERAA